MRSSGGFSLLELILTGTLIAFLIGLLLPTCAMMKASREYDPDEKAVADMSMIQAAFRRCHADCKLTDDDMMLFARFGAWPLLGADPPTGDGPLVAAGRPPALNAGDLAAFEDMLARRLINHGADATSGWRGPYLAGAAAAETFETSAESPGQKSKREAGRFIEARTLPVITDPWSKDYNPDAPERLSYYRFFIPAEPDGSAHYPWLVTLVCTGPNGKLDTGPTDIDEFTKEIRAKKDDLVLRLLPRAARR
jgi:type II secretory pathway pseudopilin PulG